MFILWHGAFLKRCTVTFFETKKLPETGFIRIHCRRQMVIIITISDNKPGFLLIVAIDKNYY